MFNRRPSLVSAVPTGRPSCLETHPSMTSIRVCERPLPDSARTTPTAPDPAVLRARRVHRAVAELRRGTPLVLTEAPGTPGLAVLAAEVATTDSIAELARLANTAPVLVVAPERGAAVLPRPARHDVPGLALHLPDGLLTPAVLRGLADPTAPQLLPNLPEPAALPSLAPAALALAKLARLLPAVLAAPFEPLEAAAAPEWLAVAAADVLAHRATPAILRRVAEAPVPLDAAPDARVIAYRESGSGTEHLAILIGRPETAVAGRVPLVRLHSECFTGDLLGSLRCDCGPQLRGAIRRMAAEGGGVLLYLAQEGRGIGLVNKLRAYAMQDRGLDTLDANRALGWEADERNFLVAATMLEELGVTRVRLLTNNPDKLSALAACGIDVVERAPHAFAPNGINDQYLATKAERFGHLLG